MFGLDELKKKSETRGDPVICPVIACGTQVKKMTKGILKSLDVWFEKVGVQRIPAKLRGHGGLLFFLPIF